MTFLISLLLAAAPVNPFRGFEKPVHEERGTWGDSELAKGKVKIYCADVGRWCWPCGALMAGELVGDNLHRIERRRRR